MELKLRIRGLSYQLMDGFNRTFMELKQGSLHAPLLQTN